MNPAVLLRRRTLASTVAVCALSALALPAAASAALTPVVFGYTGAEQTYTAPVGVGSIQVTAVGGSGGGIFDQPLFSGGVGATVTATLQTSSFETLSVRVGGNGALDYDPARGLSAAPGGWNGGGDGPFGNGGAGGGGGGATDLRRDMSESPIPLDGRLIVAGGGGGAGQVSEGHAGLGGDAGQTGGDASNGPVFDALGGLGGQPGGDKVGGLGGAAHAVGSNSAAGGDGTEDTGGDGSSYRSAGGGGGGGYGGGGGGGGGTQASLTPYQQAGGGGGGGGGSWARSSTRCRRPFVGRRRR